MIFLGILVNNNDNEINNETEERTYETLKPYYHETEYPCETEETAELGKEDNVLDVPIVTNQLLNVVENEGNISKDHRKSKYR